MAVAIVTDWTILQNEAALGATATLPTFAAGSNRVVEILIATYNGAGNTSISTSATANGESATFIDGYTTGVDRTAVGVYQFLESQISAINGQTLTTAGASGSQKSVAYRVLSDCKQSLPFSVNKAYTSTGALLTMSLARASSSYTTVVSFSSISTVIASTNPSRDGGLTLTSGRIINYGSEPDTENISNTTVTSNSRTATVVYNREAPPSQSITSVNDDDEINAGVANTAEVVGYVAGVNPVVSGTVGSLALTGVSQTGTTVSFTPPAPTNAAYWPEPDATHTLTLTDGTNPSTFSAPFRPLAGYTSVPVATPDNADEYKLGYWATTPPVNGDRIMADFTVDPDTSFSGATDGLHVWYHWVLATSTMYIYEATIGGGVIIDNRGLSIAGVSVTGLSVSGLSVTGL